MRGFADHDHECVDCDMIVQAFERVRRRAQVHETGRRGRSLLYSFVFSVIVHACLLGVHACLLRHVAGRRPLIFALRILLFGLYVFDFFVFFVSSSLLLI